MVCESFISIKIKVIQDGLSCYGKTCLKGIFIIQWPTQSSNYYHFLQSYHDAIPVVLLDIQMKKNKVPYLG